MIKSPPIGFTEDNFCAVVRASDPQAKDIKTETRRLLKVRDLSQELTNELNSFYQDGDGNWIGCSDDSPNHAEWIKKAYPKGSNKGIKSKYQIGDRCYLTEPTQIDIFRGQNTVDVQYFWHKSEIQTKAITVQDSNKILERMTGAYSKQTARFMLKSFARYWVEITDVRIERLLDITVEAAVAEGIKSYTQDENSGYDKVLYWDYLEDRFAFTCPKRSYISEIEMLHGKAIADSNPWLWVYKFKLVGGKQ